MTDAPKPDYDALCLFCDEPVGEWRWDGEIGAWTCPMLCKVCEEKLLKEAEHDEFV